jgi:hypothetical protein
MTRPPRFFVLAGWDAYRKRCIPSDASPKELEAAKQAYFAGAAILQETIMRALSPSPHTTPDDMTVMEDLDRELRTFGRELDRKFGVRQ